MAQQAIRLRFARQRARPHAGSDHAGQIRTYHQPQDPRYAPRPFHRSHLDQSSLPHDPGDPARFGRASLRRHTASPRQSTCTQYLAKFGSYDMGENRPWGTSFVDVAGTGLQPDRRGPYLDRRSLDRGPVRGGFRKPPEPFYLVGDAEMRDLLAMRRLKSDLGLLASEPKRNPAGLHSYPSKGWRRRIMTRRLERQHGDLDVSPARRLPVDATLQSRAWPSVVQPRPLLQSHPHTPSEVARTSSRPVRHTQKSIGSTEISQYRQGTERMSSALEAEGQRAQALRVKPNLTAPSSQISNSNGSTRHGMATATHFSRGARRRPRTPPPPPADTMPKQRAATRAGVVESKGRQGDPGKKVQDTSGRSANLTSTNPILGINDKIRVVDDDAASVKTAYFHGTRTNLKTLFTGATHGVGIPSKGGGTVYVRPDQIRTHPEASSKPSAAGRPAGVCDT